MSASHPYARETACEVLGLGGAGYSRSRSHDEFALWDEHIGSLGAKPDAHVAVARVFLDDVCDVVGRNAECIDHRRRRMNSHLQFPALFGATAAPGKNCTQEPFSSPKFDSAPHYYGWLFRHLNYFATGGRA